MPWLCSLKERQGSAVRCAWRQTVTGELFGGRLACRRRHAGEGGRSGASPIRPGKSPGAQAVVDAAALHQLTHQHGAARRHAGALHAMATLSGARLPCMPPAAIHVSRA